MTDGACALTLREFSLPLEMLENLSRGFRADRSFIDYRVDLIYNYEVIFEWDENKAKSNWRKHKIDFTEAISVFSDALSITIHDPDHSFAEENRFIDIGMSEENHLLVVVYTEFEERIRIISARKATAAERRKYEEERNS